MKNTPEYTKKAVKNYREKFDVVQLRLPKGKKEDIEKIADGKSVHDFIVDCILNAIKNESNTQDPGAVPSASDTDFAEYDEKRQQEELQAMLDAARARHATNNYEDREQKRRDTIAAASDINEGLADYKKPNLDTYLND